MLHPRGLEYIASRLELLQRLEQMRKGGTQALDYLRMYVADIRDYQRLEQLRDFLLQVASIRLEAATRGRRDPTPLNLRPFAALRTLEIHDSDLSTAAVTGIAAIRPQLEKLVVQNSVVALEHVLAPERSQGEAEGSPWPALKVASFNRNTIGAMDASLLLLPALEVLSLSRNRITEVRNLENAPKLHTLDASFNAIASVQGIGRLCRALTALNLASNAVRSSAGLEQLIHLEFLDLSNNLLCDFAEVNRLAGALQEMKSLYLLGNPLSCKSDYRMKVFEAFHDEMVLDGRRATPLEMQQLRAMRNAIRGQFKSVGQTLNREGSKMKEEIKRVIDIVQDKAQPGRGRKSMEERDADAQEAEVAGTPELYNGFLVGSANRSQLESLMESARGALLLSPAGKNPLSLHQRVNSESSFPVSNILVDRQGEAASPPRYQDGVLERYFRSKLATVEIGDGGEGGGGDDGRSTASMESSLWGSSLAGSDTAGEEEREECEPG